MFNRILVPTDFSRASDAALTHARMLAGSTSATVHLLHVVDNAFLATVLADPRDYENAAYEKLQQRLSGESPGSILAVQRSEAPADEITRYARAYNIDLIVMGTHGRGRVAHLLLGSVAERVARTAPCPVLTLRETPRTPTGRRPRILVPTDFSPCSDAALGCAKRMAARMRGSVCLLHVIADSVIGVTSGPESCAPAYLEAPQDQTENARIELGSRMLADSRSRIVTTADIVFGASAAMISAYAADHAFDMIVMGTHGRSGIAHLPMGSVAESVIRIARCPVLTVNSRYTAQVRAVRNTGVRSSLTEAGPRGERGHRTSRSGDGPDPGRSRAAALPVSHCRSGSSASFAPRPVA
jgi:nucleotide-binding universal stress UspA family protein